MAIVAGRPLGTVSGAHVTNFSTTAGQKSLAPAKKLPVNSAVVFVLAIVFIVFYLEKG